MKKLLIVLLCFSGTLIYSQKHDNNWQICSSVDHEPPIKYWFLNFNHSPPSLVKYFSPISITRSNLVMSDSSGNIIFYSNGVQIANALNNIMENGDSINQGIYWTNVGYQALNSMIALPDMNQIGKYYVIYCHYDTTDYDPAVQTSVLYAIIDMNTNGGLGTVLTKDNLLVNGYFLSFPSATKHGNGRDWWIITPEWLDNRYYIQLQTPQGFSQPIIQEIGTSPSIYPEVFGNKLFTPDGATCSPTTASTTSPAHPASTTPSVSMTRM
jgi:hypothetical protein